MDDTHCYLNPIGGGRELLLLRTAGVQSRNIVVSRLRHIPNSTYLIEQKKGGEGLFLF